MHSQLGFLFNQPMFAAHLKERRGAKSFRQAAKEIAGISHVTLMRLEGDENPSFEAYLRLCRWGRWPVRMFVKAEGNYSP